MDGCHTYLKRKLTCQKRQTDKYTINTIDRGTALKPGAIYKKYYYIIFESNIFVCLDVHWNMHIDVSKTYVIISDSDKNNIKLVLTLNLCHNAWDNNLWMFHEGLADGDNYLCKKS